MLFGLNLNELLIGSIVGGLSAILVGWWALLVSPITAFLWALSGMNGKDKIWRRLGVPLVVSLSVSIVRHSLIPIVSIPLAFGVLSIGYGIPDETDSGSFLGQFFTDVLKLDKKQANIAVRSTIYILLALSFIPAFL